MGCAASVKPALTDKAQKAGGGKDGGGGSETEAASASSVDLTASELSTAETAQQSGSNKHPQELKNAQAASGGGGPVAGPATAAAAAQSAGKVATTRNHVTTIAGVAVVVGEVFLAVGEANCLVAAALQVIQTIRTRYTAVLANREAASALAKRVVIAEGPLLAIQAHLQAMERDLSPQAVAPPGLEIALTAVKEAVDQVEKIITEWSAKGAGFFGTLRQGLVSKSFGEDFKQAAVLLDTALQQVIESAIVRTLITTAETSRTLDSLAKVASEDALARRNDMQNLRTDVERQRSEMGATLDAVLERAELTHDLLSELLEKQLGEKLDVMKGTLDSIRDGQTEQTKLIEGALRLIQAGQHPLASGSDTSPASIDCFIGYRVNDTGEGHGADGSVFKLRAALEERGFAVFIGEKSITAGPNDYPAQIDDALSRATVFIALCSPGYAAIDSWSRRELNMALDLNKPIIPVWHSGPYPPDKARVFLTGLHRVPRSSVRNASPQAPFCGASLPAVTDEIVAALDGMNVPRSRALRAAQGPGRPPSSIMAGGETPRKVSVVGQEETDSVKTTEPQLTEEDQTENAVAVRNWLIAHDLKERAIVISRLLRQKLDVASVKDISYVKAEDLDKLGLHPPLLRRLRSALGMPNTASEEEVTKARELIRAQQEAQLNDAAMLAGLTAAKTVEDRMRLETEVQNARVAAAHATAAAEREAVQRRLQEERERHTAELEAQAARLRAEMEAMTAKAVEEARLRVELQKAANVESEAMRAQKAAEFEEHARQLREEKELRANEKERMRQELMRIKAERDHAEEKAGAARKLAEAEIAQRVAAEERTQIAAQLAQAEKDTAVMQARLAEQERATAAAKAADAEALASAAEKRAAIAEKKAEEDAAAAVAAREARAAAAAAEARAVAQVAEAVEAAARAKAAQADAESKAAAEVKAAREAAAASAASAAALSAKGVADRIAHETGAHSKRIVEAQERWLYLSQLPTHTRKELKEMEIMEGIIEAEVSSADKRGKSAQGDRAAAASVPELRNSRLDELKARWLFLHGQSKPSAAAMKEMLELEKQIEVLERQQSAYEARTT